MLLATPNVPIVLSMLATDGRIDLFGQARVYNSSNTLVATVDLPHTNEGLYAALYTPTTEGYYSVMYQLYFDSGHTVDAGYNKSGENLDVNSLRTNVLRVLGLVHENSLVDLQTYDSNDNLTSARIRSYNSSANVLAAQIASPAAYSTGLLFEYTVNATYLGDKLQTYYISRVS